MRGAWFLAAALAAGCASPGGPTPAVGPGTPGEMGAPDGTGSDRDGTDGSGVGAAGPAGRAPAGEAPALLVERAPGLVEREVYASTMEIPGPGYYAVDLASGRVESWRLKGRSPEDTHFALSPDRRWMVLQDGERVIWFNRESGDAFSWLTSALSLRAAVPDRFLFQAVQGGTNLSTFHLADGQFRLVQTFTVDLGGQGAARAALSPDGSKVVLSTSREGFAVDPAADVRVYLVDAAGGEVRDLGPPPQPDEGIVLAADLLPLADQLVVSYVVQVVEPTGLGRASAIVRRYSWQGELLAVQDPLGDCLNLREEASVSGSRPQRISPQARSDHTSDCRPPDAGRTGDPDPGARGSQGRAAF